MANSTTEVLITDAQFIYSARHDTVSAKRVARAWHVTEFIEDANGGAGHYAVDKIRVSIFVTALDEKGCYVFSYETLDSVDGSTFKSAVGWEDRLDTFLRYLLEPAISDDESGLSKIFRALPRAGAIKL